MNMEKTGNKESLKALAQEFAKGIKTQGDLSDFTSELVHEAGIQDRDGAKLVFLALMTVLTTLLIVWADGGYAGKLLDWVKERQWGWQLEIVKRNDDMKGFVVLPHRWIVERTFAWYGNYRLLAKEYEYSTTSSEADLDLVMIHLMLRRLAR